MHPMRQGGSEVLLMVSQIAAVEQLSTDSRSDDQKFEVKGGAVAEWSLSATW